MNKHFISSFGLVLAFVAAGFFTSCQKDEAVTDVDNFVQLSTRGIESKFGFGISGCYELVFPVTIQFSDGTTVEVADYPALKQAIRDWFVTNGGKPDPANRPTLVFPIQVLNQAGEILDVASPEAMQELLLLCKPVGGGGHHGGGGSDTLGGGGHDTLHGGGHGGGHHGGGDHNGGGHGNPGACFTLVFPVTISFPDSTQVTVNSQEELKQATHDWNKANPGQHARPQLVFPLTVTLKDGTQVTVNSKEELEAIKDACRG